MAKGKVTKPRSISNYGLHQQPLISNTWWVMGPGIETNDPKELQRLAKFLNQSAAFIIQERKKEKNNVNKTNTGGFGKRSAN